MTAEFAAVFPAVVLVLVLALGCVQLAGEQLRLQAAVAEVARSVGRGGPAAHEPIDQISLGGTIAQRHRNGLVCVTATVPGALGVLEGITVSATSCALDDGQ